MVKERGHPFSRSRDSFPRGDANASVSCGDTFPKGEGCAGLRRSKYMQSSTVAARLPT